MATRCINCGLNLRRIYRVPVTAFDEVNTQLLREWISPTILSQEHALCRECKELLVSSESGAPRQLGHGQVCLGCGASVLRGRTSYDIASQQPQYREYFQNSAGEFLGPHLTRACLKCFLRARKASLRKVKVKEENEEEGKVGMEAEQEGKITKPGRRLQVSALSLPNYRRIEAGAHCMFLDCGRNSVCVPLQLRQQFLTEHRLYIPTGARICRDHLDTHEPAALTADTLNTFTDDQISDMMFLLKKYIPIDFGDIEAMDRSLRKVWLGVSWEEFRDILEQTRGLSNVEDAKLLLAIYLTKRRTGENEEVLASLFQMSRDELERKLLLATDCMELNLDTK